MPSEELNKNGGLSQLDKFKEAARNLDTDDDEQRFKEQLRRLVKHRPAGKPPE